MKNLRITAAALAAAIGITGAAMDAASAAVITTGGSTGLQLTAQKLAIAFKARTGIRVTVAGGGSGAGIAGANTGRFDIGNSSREPRSSDPSGLQFWPITKEPFVVIVSPRNPVSSLTPTQIKGIFTGTITNWRQVGGPNKAIKVYSRIGTSGTLSTFRTLFLDGSAVTSSAPTLASNGLVRTKVANDPNAAAVGFVTYAYTVGTRIVKPLKVSNVAPTLQNVVAGRYKQWGYQFFVTKGAPRGRVSTYIRWVRSAAGARIIARYAIPTTDPVKTT